MDSIQFSILTGVFSGILTSTIIWVFMKLIYKVFIPWYQNSIYRGINISGQWTSKLSFGGGVKVEQFIELKQKGHKIVGLVTSRNYIPNREDETSILSVKGEIFDNYVDIEYRIDDRRFIGRGSILLKVIEGGSRLEGSLLAIDRFSSEIMTSDNVIWNRK